MPVCGTFDGKPASGCEAETQIEDLKNLKPEKQVGLERTLQLSTEGFITLTYKGPIYPSTGELRTRSFLRLVNKHPSGPVCVCEPSERVGCVATWPPLPSCHGATHESSVLCQAPHVPSH